MENKNNSNRIHPLVAAAAIAVLLASLIGIAAMTGLLPNSNSAGAHEKAIAALDKEAAEKAEQAQAAEERAAEAHAAAEKARQAQLKEDNRLAADKARTAKSSSKVTQAQICHECGRVESVRVVQTAANPSGVGVVGGAVVGGLLGNQVGKGSGRSLATVAGVVGGGFAGNEIEKRTRTASTYEVSVRMEDGKIRSFPYNNQPAWGIGDRVRVENGYLRAR